MIYFDKCNLTLKILECEHDLQEKLFHKKRMSENTCVVLPISISVRALCFCYYWRLKLITSFKFTEHTLL